MKTAMLATAAKMVVHLICCLLSMTAIASDPNLLIFTSTPSIPAIPVNAKLNLMYTVENRVSTTSLPIYPYILNQSGQVDDSIIQRIDSAVNDCGSPGTFLLRPFAQCNLSFQLTAPSTMGEVSQRLSIDYRGRRPLESPIVFTTTHPIFVYMTNENSNTVTQCTVSSQTGLFDSATCGDSGAGATFNIPQYFVFENNNLYAYVVTIGTASVRQCHVDNTTGQFSDCSNTGSGFSSPRGIVFQTINAQSYAYVTNFFGNTVSQCRVGSMGLFTSCVDSQATGTPFSFPFGIMVFETIGAQLYAYVVSESPGSVIQCPVDSVSGLFGFCVNSGADHLNTPRGLAFQTIGTQLYAYIANNGGGVTQCQINNVSGLFSHCQDSGATGVPLSNTNGLAFETIASQLYAYVTISTGSASSVVQCPVSSATGLFGICIDSGAPPSSANDYFGINFLN